MPEMIRAKYILNYTRGFEKKTGVPDVTHPDDELWKDITNDMRTRCDPHDAWQPLKSTASMPGRQAASAEGNKPIFYPYLDDLSRPGKTDAICGAIMPIIPEGQ